jgi:hypothetical protein
MPRSIKMNKFTTKSDWLSTNRRVHLKLMLKPWSSKQKLWRESTKPWKTTANRFSSIKSPNFSFKGPLWPQIGLKLSNSSFTSLKISERQENIQFIAHWPKSTKSQLTTNLKRFSFAQEIFLTSRACCQNSQLKISWFSNRKNSLQNF